MNSVSRRFLSILWLTMLAGAPASSLYADSDSDGKIVFTRANGGHRDIWVMDFDGTNKTRLTDSPFRDSSPQWSPDGKRILFSRAVVVDEGGTTDIDEDIYVMNADGSQQTRLTFTRHAYEPCWSPDGSRIAFRDVVSDTEFDTELFTMMADGTGITQLTHGFEPEDCAWSPDGTKIAFGYLISTGDDKIVLVDANDGTPLSVPVELNLSTSPAWSPAGDNIVFAAESDFEFLQHMEVYVVPASGGTPSRLTRNGDYDGHPRYGPSGTAIVFASEREGWLIRDIYVMSANGFNQVRLTSDGESDEPSLGPDARGPSLSVSLPVQDGFVVTDTFTVTGSAFDAGSSVASIQVKIDGGSFQSAISQGAGYWYFPVALTSQGNHSLAVRATDGFGNMTDQTIAFMLDSVAPDTFIVSAVDRQGKAIRMDVKTSSTSAKFTFSGADDSGVAGFECRLDSGEFGACTSPMSYATLKKGSHTFQVRSKDTAGFVDPTPASFIWSIATASVK